MSKQAPTPLSPDRLYHRCDPAIFEFEDTSSLENFEDVIGQDRAMEAVHFGVGMKGSGFNLYVLGPPGIGKHSLLRTILENEAAGKSCPQDFCYVNNFKEPTRPLMLTLPAGHGEAFCKAMSQLVEDLLSSMPAAFESEEFQARGSEIEEGLKKRLDQALSALREEAEKHGFALVRTSSGYAFAPMKEGKVVPKDELEHLSEKEQEDMQARVAELQERSEKLFRDQPTWRRDAQKKLKQLAQDTARFVVERLVEELKDDYEDEAVRAFLDTVIEDVVEHGGLFASSEPRPNPITGESSDPKEMASRRYAVNLLVNQCGGEGAPIIYEDNPTFQNLVGQVEHRSHMGNLVTDFSLIKPGALHRANGGYLILDAHKVLTRPFAWEGLKRVLQAGEIRIDSLGRIFGAISTVSLEPQPIPSNVKVCLLGDRLLYYLLCARDPDFAELFKVAADFEDRISRDKEEIQLYARMLGTLARREGLRPLLRDAVARVIEHASRLADDAAKMSLLMGTVMDLLREADYWAGESGVERIDRSHIQTTIDKQFFRAGRVYQHAQEAIERGILMIDTEGKKVGQVNALAVMQLGAVRFGQPHRITATARFGEGQVLDIEREVKLGGATHSKGVMILSGFLADRYAANGPLSLSATLVFEQSYGPIDGDSASLAELCALLSAISRVPIQQRFAMTGSVNQKGEVQAIGGVNEKIEGFFDVCRAAGLSGDQGVLIPASNVTHLMLRPDIVAEAEAGRFHIYPVATVDEALGLLTGKTVGKIGARDTYPKDTVNYLVAERLAHFQAVKQKLNKKETPHKTPSKAAKK